MAKSSSEYDRLQMHGDSLAHHYQANTALLPANLL